MAILGHELHEQVKQALLPFVIPEETRSIDLHIEAGKVVTLKIVSFPPKDQVTNLLAVTKEYELREAGARARGAVNVVFDGPPGPECGRFVEVEDDDGCSINAGTWTERSDGLWALRIQMFPEDEKP